MEHFGELKARLRRQGIFQEKIEANARMKSIVIKCSFFISFISIIISSFWYYLFDEAQTPKKHSESLYFFLVALFILSWYSAFVFQSEKYAELLNELNAIIAKRMTDPTVNLIYEFTNNTIKWMTKQLCVVLQIFVWIYFSIPAILSFYKYVSSGYSNESFQQAFPASYPFDWRTPLGYVACVSIQAVQLITLAEIYVSGIMFTIGVCMQISNFASDIKEKLDQFNRIIISSESELTIDDQTILRKRLNEIIEFHAEAREFAQRFSDANNTIVFASPTFVIAVFGCLVLQFKKLTETGDIVGSVQLVIVVVGVLMSFFLFCHYGGKITQQFEEIGDAVYQLEWYRLPLKMQKDLRIVIALSQKRIYMRGYGDTRTTHSVFRKILRSKVYFFLLARKI